MKKVLIAICFVIFFCSLAYSQDYIFPKKEVYGVMWKLSYVGNPSGEYAFDICETLDEALRMLPKNKTMFMPRIFRMIPLDVEVIEGKENDCSEYTTRTYKVREEK